MTSRAVRPRRVNPVRDYDKPPQRTLLSTVNSRIATIRIDVGKNSLPLPTAFLPRAFRIFLCPEASRAILRAIRLFTG
jgi:hypothetical protein